MERKAPRRRGRTGSAGKAKKRRRPLLDGLAPCDERATAQDPPAIEPSHDSILRMRQRTPPRDEEHAAAPDTTPGLPESPELEFCHDSILRMQQPLSRSPSMSPPQSPSTSLSRSPSRSPSPLSAVPGGKAQPFLPADGDAQVPRENASVPEVRPQSAVREPVAVPWTVLQTGTVAGADFSVLRLHAGGVAVSGTAWVSVVRGALNVLGAHLTSESAPVHVVSSPLAPFAVTLVPEMMPRARENKKAVRNVREKRALHTAAVAQSELRFTLIEREYECLGDECVVLIVQSLQSDCPPEDAVSVQYSADLPQSIELYLAHAGLPSVSSGQPAVAGMQFAPPGSKVPAFKLWSDWAGITGAIDKHLSGSARRSSLRMLVCGPGGSGKSMFVRCALNHVIGRCGTVVLVETDLGQPEMSLPGLVAAHVVRSYRTGASIAANRAVPVSARYLGETTAREEPDTYAAFVSAVVADGRRVAEELNCPLIVNSDGWVTSIGADLLHHVADCVEPSHMVEMRFPTGRPRPLLTQVCGRVAMDRMHVLVSPRPSRETVFPSSAQRELHIAAYFGGELAAGRVYNVSLDDMQVRVHGEDVAKVDLYATLNASLVALAVASESNSDMHTWNVRGFGLVRGFNPEDGVLFVCTPVPEDILEECNALLVNGGVQVPSAMFFASAEASAPWLRPPYIVSSIVATGEHMRSRGTLLRRG